MKYEELSEKIIDVFYRVYRELGYGFLEKVYERAMIVLLCKGGLNFENQYPIKVIFEGEIVGDYYADFLVEDKIVVEIKTSRGLCKADEKQLLNYLKCTDKEVGLLLNFGEKPQVVRKVFDNEFKRKYSD